MTLNKNIKQKQGHRGFSIIEILIASGILSVVLIAIWSLFLFSITQVGIARARTIATNIANEKIEIMRNMPYEDLGTTSGHPPGAIPSTETLTRNGIDYHISTAIRYYDSAADSLATGLVEGKHIRYYWDGCNWDPSTTETITIDFYNDGVWEDIPFQDYVHGNNFNWSGKITVDGEDQHFHIHTTSEACTRLEVQTQNVEKPFKLYVDGVLISTYTAPDTFMPGDGVTYEIVGQGGTVPADIYPNDYLQVHIEVYWDQFACPKPVVMSTFIAQKGAETAADTGVIIIEVLDANGEGVADAAILIENDNLGIAPINETTDINGFRLIPVLDPDVEGYEATITKDGYSTDGTYDYSGGNQHPAPPPLTVEAQKITEASFAIDLLADMSIDMIQMDDSPANAVNVHIEGSKLIGTDPDLPKYTPTDNETDAVGHVEVVDLEWDTYTLTAELPTGDVEVTINLAPATVQDIVITPHNLLITLYRQGTSQKLDGATVTLSRADISYAESELSSQQGEAVFPSLQTGDYELEITLDEYVTYTDTLTIGMGANTEDIYLVPE